MRVRGHAAWVVAPFAPQRRSSGLLVELRTVTATLRRQTFAHTVRCADRRGVQQEHRGESERVERGSHEVEIRVYRSSRSPQQIPSSGGATTGVKPMVLDVGYWERRAYSRLLGFTPAAHGVNVVSFGSIPKPTPVRRRRSENRQSPPPRGLRAPRSRGTVPRLGRRTGDFEGTTGGNQGFSGLDR